MSEVPLYSIPPRKTKCFRGGGSCKHGLSTSQFPVSAYAGSFKNVKAPKADCETIQGYLAH